MNKNVGWLEMMYVSGLPFEARLKKSIMRWKRGIHISSSGPLELCSTWLKHGISKER